MWARPVQVQQLRVDPSLQDVQAVTSRLAAALGPAVTPQPSNLGFKSRVEVPGQGRALMRPIKDPVLPPAGGRWRQRRNHVRADRCNSGSGQQGAEWPCCWSGLHSGSFWTNESNTCHVCVAPTGGGLQRYLGKVVMATVAAAKVQLMVASLRDPWVKGRGLSMVPAPSRPGDGASRVCSSASWVTPS